MKQHSRETPPRMESKEQKIARLEAILIALEQEEQELLRALEKESTPEPEIKPETAPLIDKGNYLKDRLRQAGKTALITAALSIGTGTSLHQTETTSQKKSDTSASKTEEVVISKSEVQTKDTTRSVLYSPEVIEKIKDEPIIDAEKIIAERIENDPSIHEKAQRFIERMDASLLNKLSTSAKIMYLNFIEENMNASTAGREAQIHFLVDKDQAQLYVTDQKNKLIAETPVIIGATEGNGLNGVTLDTKDVKNILGQKKKGKYTTPAGFWELSSQNPDPHYGENQRRILIGEAEQEQNIMIHPPLLGLSSEDSLRQREAYFSKNPKDRRMSNGCIRTPMWFLKKYAHLLKDGTVFGVSPEKEGEKEVYIDPVTAEMHLIGSKSWSNSDHAAILRDIQRVQQERREYLKNQKK